MPRRAQCRSSTHAVRLSDAEVNLLLDAVGYFQEILGDVVAGDSDAMEGLPQQLKTLKSLGRRFETLLN